MERLVPREHFVQTNDHLKQTSRRLTRHIDELAIKIGVRSTHVEGSLSKTYDYIEREWTLQGFKTVRKPFTTESGSGVNLEVEIKGTEFPEEIVILGAHDDSVLGSPGANDNASGVAALLEISRSFIGLKPKRTVRFVAFANEEPPFFDTEAMGSYIYASDARLKDEKIIGMISLDEIGYYSDSQDGNFIAFVGNEDSSDLIAQAAEAFRRNANFPVQELVVPDDGITNFAVFPHALEQTGYSDHSPFWGQGFRAFMVTDTAMFRYPHYHKESDTPGEIHYPSLTLVTAGLTDVMKYLSLSA